MNRFDDNMNNVSSARDVFEYTNFNAKKEINEMLYKQIPIGQNDKIIKQLEKLGIDVNKTKTSEKITIILMIITLIFTIVSVVISIIK